MWCRTRRIPRRQSGRRARGVRDKAGRADARVAATYLSITEIHLDLRGSQSLKDKRRLVLSLKALIRQRFVAAVAETADQDDRRMATLVVVLIGGSEVRERAAELEHFVEARCPDGCSFARDLVSLKDIRG